MPPKRKLQIGAKNLLFYGDNLAVLREHIDDESVDLVYLDPPFNSNRSYNVLFKHKSGTEAQAQIEAFDDTWTWSHEAELAFFDLLRHGSSRVADGMEAMRKMLGDNDVLAYLVMMTARLVELRRVLKPTGSLYLHCDPTASHYLKVMCDAIFGVENFRNEVIWQRTAAKGLQTQRLPTNHDVLLSYQRGPGATWNWEAAFVGYEQDNLDEKTASKYRLRDPDGRVFRLASLINPSNDRPNLTYEFLGVTRVWRWTRERMQKAYDDGLVVQSRAGMVPQFKRYLDEQRGRPLGDVWTDISPINSRAAERLHYPTQKPLELLERIIALSSNPGDVILDPFCGCGTTVDAAQRQERRWIGIDITFLSIDLIDTRLRDTFGQDIRSTYEIVGIPRDVESARSLFARNAFDFERWAVSLVDGTPNLRQVGDRGSDGVIRFPIDNREIGKAIVSVKGGRQLNPSMVRDLAGTVAAERAELGVLIVLEEPTRGMSEAARAAGNYGHALTGRNYPRVQIVSIPELLSGKRVDMPTPFLPYLQAQRHVPDNQVPLF